MKKEEIQPRHPLVAFDGVSHFTTVSIEEILEIINHKYKTPGYVMDLTTQSVRKKLLYI